MLPVNQLCSWLPIMLLAINYAQNYASIIGKGLLCTHPELIPILCRMCGYSDYWIYYSLVQHSQTWLCQLHILLVFCTAPSHAHSSVITHFSCTCAVVIRISHTCSVVIQFSYTCSVVIQSHMLLSSSLTHAQ